MYGLLRTMATAIGTELTKDHIDRVLWRADIHHTGPQWCTCLLCTLLWRRVQIIPEFHSQSIGHVSTSHTLTSPCVRIKKICIPTLWRDRPNQGWPGGPWIMENLLLQAISTAFLWNELSTTVFLFRFWIGHMDVAYSRWSLVRTVERSRLSACVNIVWRYQVNHIEI